MANCCTILVFRSFRILNLKFSTTCFVDNKWRLQKGLEREPRQFSPLTILPDYSFIDGRPVPLSATKWKKINHQRDLCRKIVELSHEMDVGLQQYYERKEQEEKNKETIISNKLKPKGAALLAKNQKSSLSDS